MGTIRIRNVPDDLHETMRRRAADEGMTVSDYLLALIRRDLALPSQREWLTTLSTREPVEGTDVVESLDAVRAARDENFTQR